MGAALPASRPRGAARKGRGIGYKGGSPAGGRSSSSCGWMVEADGWGQVD